MLFDVLGLVDETTARSIAFTVQALDPQAKITANLARGRLLVESNQDEHAISDALRAAGFPASLAPEHPEGSTCCGSCGSCVWGSAASAGALEVAFGEVTAPDCFFTNTATSAKASSSTITPATARMAPS